MVKLKKFYRPTILFVILISLGLISFGCNLTDTPPKPVAEKIAENSLGEAIVKTENEQANDQETNQNLLIHPTRDSNVERILADGSQYIKMKDAYGNTSEFRYFDVNTGLKYISMQTLVDGSTSIVIRTQEGSIKRVKPSLLTSPWSTTVREIALLAGVSPDYNIESERNLPSAVETKIPDQISDQNIKGRTETQVKSAEEKSSEQDKESKPVVLPQNKSAKNFTNN